MYSHRPRYRPLDKYGKSLILRQLLPFMFEKPIAMSYYMNHQTIHGLCIHKSKKQISYTDWWTEGKKINGNLLLLTISLGYLISSKTMVHQYSKLQCSKHNFINSGKIVLFEVLLLMDPNCSLYFYLALHGIDVPNIYSVYKKT